VIHGGIFEMIQWMESRAMSSRPIGHAFMHFNINTSESAAIYINISKLNTANVIIITELILINLVKMVGSKGIFSLKNIS
jgi:hypothetical protein